MFWPVFKINLNHSILIHLFLLAMTLLTLAFFPLGQ